MPPFIRVTHLVSSHIPINQLLLTRQAEHNQWIGGGIFIIQPLPAHCEWDHGKSQHNRRQIIQSGALKKRTQGKVLTMQLSTWTLVLSPADDIYDIKLKERKLSATDDTIMNTGGMLSPANET